MTKTGKPRNKWPANENLGLLAYLHPIEEHAQRSFDKGGDLWMETQWSVWQGLNSIISDIWTIYTASDLPGLFKEHWYIFCFILLMHSPVYQDFSTQLDSSARPHIPCPAPGYNARLLTLYQNRANNQYRTANQIEPTLRVSSNTKNNSLPSKCWQGSTLLDLICRTRTGISKLISHCSSRNILNH